MSSEAAPRLPPPRGPSAGGALRRLQRLLTSPRLALALLAIVLACCLVGVTVVRGVRAGQLIFSTLWFNALLVLLAISSASAFFGRFWKRKLTLVSLGMILFHVSFLGVLGGVVANGLFSFRGVLRLTEGETLELGRAEYYDEAEMGRFFDPARLRGQLTLLRMHADYEVNGEKKRAAYEVEVRDRANRERAIIYATQNLEFDGIRYFTLKEGYSILLVALDGRGREFYGLHVPLQSQAQHGGGYLYATGTASEVAAVPFPAPPDTALAEVALTYYPGVAERTGQVHLAVAPPGVTGNAKAAQTGVVPVGGVLDAGSFRLSPREVRYWVGLSVRYDPGLTAILASLCLGLTGMVMTLVGRVRQGSRKQAA